MRPRNQFFAWYAGITLAITVFLVFAALAFGWLTQMVSITESIARPTTVSALVSEGS